MEYQNTDEAIRREACEKVKQIVKAIKAIKIKYYLIFSKISAKDKERYQKLEKALERISEEHNLNKLKVALMSEVNAKYSGNPRNEERGNQLPEPDDILLACYGAIDAQKEAISMGRITQALRCQEKLQEYMQGIDLEKYRDLIINYKRKKFEDLMSTRDEIENKNEEWYKIMRAFYEAGHVIDRDNVVQLIADKSKNRRVNKIKNILVEEIEEIEEREEITLV